MRGCDGEDPPASYFEAPEKKDVAAQPAPKDKGAKADAAPAPAAAKPASATAKPATAKPAPKAAAATAAGATAPAAGAGDGDGEGGAADGDADADAGAAEAPPDDDGVQASTLKKPDCTTKTGAGGLKARWCLEKAPYVWVEPKHHRRIVRVRAEITNLQPNVSLCGIKVELESNKSAINTWPDWWPESDEDDPLDPQSSFGACD